jgi:shikimate kinase
MDTDDMLVAEARLSIKEIVAQHGWEGFRSMERAIVKRACKTDQHVIATGGGVVLDPENVRRMKNSGRLIWLRATSETIKNRMMQDPGTNASRPALTRTDSISEIEASLIERNTLYRQASDHWVETDNRAIDDICDSICQQLGIKAAH